MRMERGNNLEPYLKKKGLLVEDVCANCRKRIPMMTGFGGFFCSPDCMKKFMSKHPSAFK